MRRKLAHETAERLRHAEPYLFDALRAKLARWSSDHAAVISRAMPDLPESLGDRDQDNWESLLAVADLAGGEWAQRGRDAALRLCGQSGDAGQSSGAELLSDIRDVFETKRVSRISMSDLLQALLADEESPWSTWRGGTPMTTRNLGTMLGKYGIKSKAITLGHAGNPKGFNRSQFEDAFSRYLDILPATPLPPVTRSQPSNDAGLGVTEVPSRYRAEKPSVTPEAANGAGCDRVTEEKGGC
jgi:putative DNA primase/helicase